MVLHGAEMDVYEVRLGGSKGQTGTRVGHAICVGCIRSRSVAAGGPWQEGGQQARGSARPTLPAESFLSTCPQSLPRPAAFYLAHASSAFWLPAYPQARSRPGLNTSSSFWSLERCCRAGAPCCGWPSAITCGQGWRDSTGGLGWYVAGDMRCPALESRKGALSGPQLQPQGRAGGILQAGWVGDGALACRGLHLESRKCALPAQCTWVALLVVSTPAQRRSLLPCRTAAHFLPGSGAACVSWPPSRNPEWSAFLPLLPSCRSNYTLADGKPRVLATTQFEAAAARLAFPCFDEPAFKVGFWAWYGMGRYGE